MISVHPQFITLIATCDRPELLEFRALPSVAKQTRKPDLLIVIDDCVQHQTRNQQTVQSFSEQSGITAIYTKNLRNRGAAGAWNTGAMQALLRSYDTDRTYLSILDDDDEWLPQHLEQVENNLRSKPAVDVIAVAFERRESGASLFMKPPSVLRGSDFLTGNPGVGCGTLIVRLGTFFRAGMFDESMPACTDRDLCFRLSLLPKLVYGSLPDVSMIHYATSDGKRLSTPGKLKNRALSLFANKYRGWMSDHKYDVFSSRNKRLFGWKAEKPSKKGSAAVPLSKRGATTTKISLVIGIIVSPEEASNALFDDILLLAKDNRLSSLDVVVVSTSNKSKSAFLGEMNKWRHAGLRMHCISDISSVLPNFFSNVFPGLRPITVNRTALQYAMSHIAKHYRNSVCWILDGDSRLHGLKAFRGKISSFHFDYIGEMIHLLKAGYDAVIGTINGAAPLPRAFTVRTQLVDLLHIMGRLQQSDNDPHRPHSIAHHSKTHQDYYHDCLPQPHLEQPIGVSLLPPSASYDEFIQKLPEFLARVLSGDALTRPLLSMTTEPSQLQRGGNTLIFNPSMLNSLPNGLVCGPLQGIRRGDEIWRIFNEKISKYNIATRFFPITQVRDSEKAQAPDIERMSGDIAGHAVINALRQMQDSSNTIDSFVGSILEAPDFFTNMDHALERRLCSVQASFLRIGGVAKSMQGLINSKNAKVGKASIAVLKKIERKFNPVQFDRLQEQTRIKLNPDVVRKSLTSFVATCQIFTDMAEPMGWMRSEHRANAKALLERQPISNLPLRFLGQGGEGTVFANEKYAYKVLHRWYSRKDIKDPNFLPSLAGKWKSKQGIYSLLGAIPDSGDLLLTLPFEKTTDYKGGLGAAMVKLLANMHHNGIVYWNIKPKNLRQRGKSLWLIDYGRDIQPYNKRDFDLMIRKAWLSWRWSWRKNLPALLKKSLTNPNLPELVGYANMNIAVMQYATYTRVTNRTIGEFSPLPRRILDYGCGKGRDAIRLAALGAQVSAFDIALTTQTEALLQKMGVRVIRDITQESGVYDVILLQHVFCDIKSDKILRQCLQHAHRLLAPDGKLVVVICMSSALVKDTLFSHNLIPHGISPDKKFSYRKQIYSTNGTRPHTYRPEFVLRREFSRAGFIMASHRDFPDMDLQRMEVCTNSKEWILRPLPIRPAVTLIIRACAMDAKDAKPQIRHLIEALNPPRGFAKIILLIDGKIDNFQRAHEDGDLPALLNVANSMQRQGWIDHIVSMPEDPDEIRRINRKWLGVAGTFTHAEDRSSLSVVFAGFEKCQTQYALHIDIDMIVGRLSRKFDYLGKMLKIMHRHKAFTMALDIPGASTKLENRPSNPFRLNVRAGLTDISRLKSLLPLPIDTANGAPEKGWHRIVDKIIVKNQLRSLRGGGQKLFVLHPPNIHKNKSCRWDVVVNAAQKGYYPARYENHTEWDGQDAGWLPVKRNEKFIFVVCGHNVPEGKMRRCLDSIKKQKSNDWGVVIMDDASDSFCATFLRQWTDSNHDRVTYFMRRNQVGSLENLVFAVRQLCANPESVIVTLDMDDALIGNQVLERLRSEYDNGSDMTVGSMLRTDKVAVYPVCFQRPRANRGGNVWQHLRSFKKKLFDAIPDVSLRNSQNNYFSFAQDWAYMLPIAEMATKPIWIPDILYLYEPDTQRRTIQKTLANQEIVEITARPEFSRLQNYSINKEG